MSEIKNETFNIGDRFRGLVNGDIFVVESLPKKGERHEVCETQEAAGYEAQR